MRPSIVAGMDDYLHSLVLGIVEGLTEFLPVSSTAHLRLTEALLHMKLEDEYWKMYSIVIQLGAILCLPILFRGRILALLRTFPRGVDGDRNVFTHPLSLALIATAVTAGPAFLLKHVISLNLENLAVMGKALVGGGVVMIVVDAWRARAEAAKGRTFDESIHSWTMDEMTFGQAVWVGLCQILAAVFPGTSRSMATIAGGQIAGMSRAAALEFSFFVSMPTMAIATGYDLWKWIQGRGAAVGGDVVTKLVGPITTHEWTVLGIGFVASFVVAYLAVAWLMAWVRRRGFIPFGIYRVLVGAAVLLWMA